MVMKYNAPNGSASSIEGAGSSQVNTFYWDRKSLIEARKEMFFSQLASTKVMPKNMGKVMKVYHYLPLLDDRNINDMGLDAAGAVLDPATYFVSLPRSVVSVANVSKATAATAINDNLSGAVATAGADNSGGTGFANLTIVGPTMIKYSNLTKANAVVALGVGGNLVQASGNLYGSSKDTGTIVSKLPMLGETGGRVNRVGFKRLLIEGTFFKFGFYTEFTQDALDFDSDDMLYEHISRELVTGAVQLTEAVLQKDLIAAAGVILYSGAALDDDDITAEGGTPSIVTYDTLARMAKTLTDNRTPKETQIISGSRMTDTRTVGRGRLMYIGSDLESVVKGILDPFGDAAFIPVHKYADAANILEGEIGTVDQFRFISVPEMQHWAGAGARVGTNPGYQATGGRYDVFPMLTIGSESFSTIGFQTSGNKMMKFKIITKMPGEATADRNDPFGEQGFSSIKWYYGILVLRPERIGLIKTVARI